MASKTASSRAGKDELRRPRRRRLPRAATAPIVLTIGHSTRTLKTFTELLRAHAVTRLVDVRTLPRSRHNPQFNRDTLPSALHAVHISYTHLPALGGLRHARAESPNTGWRNASFRGFADYMQTPEFDAGLAQLIALAERERIAIMCAEALPWRCHRSLIADALLARGIRVEHIQSATRSLLHVLTPFARVKRTEVTYPLAAVADPAPADDAEPRPRRPRARRR